MLLPVCGLPLVASVLSRRRDPEVGYKVTASAALLLTPLVWDHYLSLVLLPSVAREPAVSSRTAPQRSLMRRPSGHPATAAPRR